MKIIVRLDELMARRKMKLNKLAELVGISETNLSILKTGKAKAIRFSTLEAICSALECQPGDILDIEKSLKLQQTDAETAIL
ncbi:XRE family transcriptional regulator [Candidatus Paracaedimonas acanthamoebae]|nr:XRE family transcriptional regulator [Candidatus Paracaedimonas acanthamoebae]